MSELETPAAVAAPRSDVVFETATQAADVPLPATTLPASEPPAPELPASELPALPASELPALPASELPASLQTSDFPLQTSDVPLQTSTAWARMGREVASALQTLVSAAVYATIIVTFGFQVARVDGLSMAPTLEDHDRLIVNKLVYELGDPRPGDIVMLYYPLNPEKMFVKR